MPVDGFWPVALVPLIAGLALATRAVSGRGAIAGMAVGFAITFGIIRDHKGEVTVDSEVGTGTTFRIEIPAADLQPSSGDGEQLPSPRARE